MPKFPAKRWTGYYIDRDQIFGPERSGHFYIRDRRIYGPICTPGKLAPHLWHFDEPPPPAPDAGRLTTNGDYYIVRGRIFGPRATGNFYIKRNHIYGPAGVRLPWLPDETLDGVRYMTPPSPKPRRPNQPQMLIRPAA